MTFIFYALLITGGLTILHTPWLGGACWVGAYFVSREISTDSESYFSSIIFLLAIAGAALSFFY